MNRRALLSFLFLPFLISNFILGASLSEQECYICFLTKRWNTSARGNFTIDEYMKLVTSFKGNEKCLCDFHRTLNNDDAYSKLIDSLSAEICLVRSYSKYPLCLSGYLREIFTLPIVAGQYASYICFCTSLLGVLSKLIGKGLLSMTPPRQGFYAEGDSRPLGEIPFLLVLVLAVGSKLAHSGFKYLRETPIFKEKHCYALKKTLEDIIYFEWGNKGNTGC